MQKSTSLVPSKCPSSDAKKGNMASLSPGLQRFAKSGLLTVLTYGAATHCELVLLSTTLMESKNQNKNM